MKPLRIALTKGRLEKAAVEMFDKMGLDTAALRDKGRRLILPVGDMFETVLAKPDDVLTYVEHGVCDLGVVGKDTILEAGGSFYEVLDLGVGKCRFVLAAREGDPFFGGYAVKTVATKYPHVARRFFEARGMDVRVIRIEGSVELAPLLGLADGIVDLMETGATLRENGLTVVEEILPVSARLIANIACMKLRKREMDAAIAMWEAAARSK